jgi:excinuclease ABC subunit A
LQKLVNFKFADMSIRLRGVRQNNLKNFDLEVPLGRLVVVAGLSGSGKSSLAFDTLFAEGQRRYIETFSPYARQFLDRMDKPRVDSIEGIPPAIAIEQRNSVKSTRSTVGTMTEITDYAKVLWPHLARLHCGSCGAAVRKDSPQDVWEAMRAVAPDADVLVSFELPLSQKFSLEESLALIARQGYQRLLIHQEVRSLEESLAALKAAAPSHLTLVQDRILLKKGNRARFVEACEQAYHFGKGALAVHSALAREPMACNRFSNKLHCPACDRAYRQPSPALFSFNHPIGACPACRGFGRTIAIDYDAALPDRSKTLAQGAVKPWRTASGAESQEDLLKFAKIRKVPVDVPFERLSQKHQEWVIAGDIGYGKDKDHEWPRAWYGVKGYFRWLESRAYKMHVRVLLSRYRIYQTCVECRGTRFQPEALLYRIASRSDGPWNGAGRRNGLGGNGAAAPEPSGDGLTIADFYSLPVHQALQFIQSLIADCHRGRSDPLTLVLNEVGSRLAFLDQAGLGYLTLDRATRSLSGGETERVNLTTCLGSRLVNTLFVLDEPTVGLHPRDTARLVAILQNLRDSGNSVVVVEHESGVIRAADQIIELGPGHGEAGGRVVFQGAYGEMLRAPNSLTGQYLSGRKRIEIPRRRPVRLNAVNIQSTEAASTAPAPECPALLLAGANLHNLKNLTVQIPLGRLVCVTGVSGSGKTTLVSQVLLPALRKRLDRPGNGPAASSSGVDSETGADAVDDESADLSTPEKSASAGPRLQGWEHLTGVVAVDQSSLGKTPRSNPAVYIGAFDDIRTLFAETDAARQRGLSASAFSFNSTQGQCQRCHGAGFEKIEMQFLSDVFIRCPECDGRRYRPHILEVRAQRNGSDAQAPGDADGAAGGGSWSIADLLEATVDQTIEFLKGFSGSRPAGKAVERLKLLQEAGLGYLRLGQPINTLSGGESQRLKLVSHLAGVDSGTLSAPGRRSASAAKEHILFIFDEPTTGLHFDDVRVLLKVFHRIVDAGHSVLIIEHNLDIIRSADWVIDLGPEAGEQGGRVVAQGTPEEIMSVAASHTGQALGKPQNPKSKLQKTDG